MQDSPRIHDWEQKCEAGQADSKPFVTFSPYIPHLSFQEEEVCKDHDREDEKCATIPEYTEFSSYCSKRCARNDGSSIGKSCSANSECIAGLETCQVTGLSCNDWAWHMERSALILKKADPSGLSDRDVYTGILGDNKRPACDNALLTPPSTCDSEAVRSGFSWHDNRFNSRGDILRFINAFDRTVDELVVYLKSEGLWENTVILYTTDNGFQITSSKSMFNENGYRAPMILHDPFREAADGSDAFCAGIDGCRADPAEFGGILATICDFLDPQDGNVRVFP